MHPVRPARKHDRSGALVFVEQWETMEDLMAHGGNEHMKPWRKVVKECMTAPTKIEIITPEKVDVR